MENNSEPLIQFEAFFTVSKYTFKSLGLNPYFECKEDVSAWSKWLLRGAFVFEMSILLITTALGIIFSVMILGDKDQIREFSKTVSCYIYNLMAIQQLILMRTSGSKFNEIILELEDRLPKDLETQKKYEIQRKAKETMLIMSNVLTFYIAAFVTWIFVAPAWDAISGYYSGIGYVFPLPWSIYFPWDQTQTIPFRVVLFFEFTTIHTTILTNVSVNMLLLSIVFQVQLQFEILAQNIRDVPPNDASGLYKLIHQHVQLMELTKKFASLISPMTFLNYMFSTFGLCFVLFNLATLDEKLKFATFLVIFLIQTLIMSLVGETVMQNVMAIYRCRLSTKEINRLPLEPENLGCSL